MKIEIHRGLFEIGGCITEISTETSRVFIDMGKQLPGTVPNSEVGTEKMFVENLMGQNKKEHSAVFYTHAHEDHVGLFTQVPLDVPQYISQGGQEMMLAKMELIHKRDQHNMIEYSRLAKEENNIKYKKKSAYWHLRSLNDEQKIETIKAFRIWKRPKPHTCHTPIIIGDIRITPFINCHSIYDSYMFLIEVDGKRIWHTGDYREHGYMGKGLIPTISCYATDIDVLITEGTMLRRAEICMPEREVQRKMANMMNAFKYVVVLASGTDIERNASIKEAAKTANKDLYVCGGFAMKCMKIFTQHESQPSNGLFDFHPTFISKGSKKIVTMRKKGFVLITNLSHQKFAEELTDELDSNEVLFIYSTWDGYYKDPVQVEINPNYKNFREIFTNVVDIHTSGHADRRTIKKVIETINPKEAIIAIHKEEDQSLESLDLSAELKNKIINLKAIEL